MKILIETRLNSDGLPPLEGCESYCCATCFWRGKHGCYGKEAYKKFFIDKERSSNDTVLSEMRK